MRSGRLLWGGWAALLGLWCLVLPFVASGASETAAEPVEVTAFTAPFRELEVASQIGGVLAIVHVEEGDAVGQGQPLAAFKSEVVRARLQVSEARVHAAEVELEARRSSHEVLRAEHDRAAMLFEQDVMSEQKYLEAKLQMELAGLNVQAAEAQKAVVELIVERDRAELEQTVVRAPIAGRVFRIHSREGEAVELHSPILSMVSVDPLYVVANLPIHTAGRVGVGMRAALELENRPGRPCTCTVAVVDPVADAASGTYRVKFALPNPDGALTAGAKGRLTLQIPEPSAEEAKGQGDGRRAGPAEPA